MMTRTYKIKTPTFTDKEQKIIDEILEKMVKKEGKVSLFSDEPVEVEIETDNNLDFIFNGGIQIVARNYFSISNLMGSVSWKEETPNKKTVTITRQGKIYLFAILPFLETDEPKFDVFAEDK